MSTVSTVAIKLPLVAETMEPPADDCSLAVPHDARIEQLPDLHPFSRYVNPYLADVLTKLWIDKRFVSGKGCKLIDSEGRHYLDCIAAYGALPFGSNPPEIWRSLAEVQRSGEPSLVQPALLDAAGELAEQLLAIAPANLRYATFTNSGAEAIEAAIKMCRIATRRLGILSTTNSFHGKTLAALSATGNPQYQQDSGAPAGTFHTIPFGDAEALRRELKARPGYYAAFLVEPIQGEGGIVEPPPGYLREVREACTQANVLLVLDEIQTGLGRTGTMFACDVEEVHPDVMTLAKALGGGLMPIGAVLSSPKAFSETFALNHSSTFAANALACRAALATLRLLTRDNRALVRRVNRYGKRLKQGLHDLQRQFPHLISEVLGRGFLLGIRFTKEREVWPETLLGVALEQEFFTPLFSSYMLNVEGVRVAPTLNGKTVIRIEPPLVMSRQQCEHLLAALQRALAMFSTGDTGRIFASILAGRAEPMPHAALPDNPWVRVKPRPAERRFAFLMHPLTHGCAANLDPTLQYLDEAPLKTVVRNVCGFVDPFVVNQGRVVSATGETIYGEFIALPRTAKELAQMRRREAIEYVRGALHLARSRGAQIVGLGAFTSIVTVGGRAIADEGVPITTGNSYTAVASAEATLKALALVTTRCAPPPTVAIVGATGAIGRAMALLLAEDMGRLILVGNPESPSADVHKRLRERACDVIRFVVARAAESAAFRPGTFAAEVLCGSAARFSNSQKIANSHREVEKIVARLERTGTLVLTQATSEAVRASSVVITATSATGTVVGPADLRPNAVVCDVSRPANVSRDVAAARPDVVVIDGGVIAVPDASTLGTCGLGEGLVYACMAETMMLALEGQLHNARLATELSPETLKRLRSLADVHGFRVAKLRSFGRPMEYRSAG